MDKKNQSLSTKMSKSLSFNHPLFFQVSAESLRNVQNQTKKKAESPLGKFIISGGVAWTFELFGGHYLEFLKIAKQTSEHSYTFLTKRMIQHKGILGVLDGYFPWGSIQCFIKGASFGFGQALGKQFLNKYSPFDPHTNEIMSGGMGGGFQGICLSPFLLLKTRVMTDPSFRTSGGVWKTTIESSKVGMKVIREEGVSALMKGSMVFSIKRVADWTTRFFFAEMCEVALKKHKGENLGTLDKSLASLMGGALSATATIPIDVLVATVQDAGKAGQKVRVLDIWKERISERGLIGLVQYSTKGYIARVSHVALTTLLMKTISSAVYDKYKKMARD